MNCFHVTQVPEHCAAILYPPAHDDASKIRAGTTVQQLLVAESRWHGFEWVCRKCL